MINLDCGKISMQFAWKKQAGRPVLHGNFPAYLLRPEFFHALLAGRFMYYISRRKYCLHLCTFLGAQFCFVINTNNLLQYALLLNNKHTTTTTKISFLLCCYYSEHFLSMFVRQHNTFKCSSDGFTVLHFYSYDTPEKLVVAIDPFLDRQQCIKNMMPSQPTNCFGCQGPRYID